MLINELKRRFQQKRGLPVAAEIEKTLLSTANGTFKQICDDLQLYQGDLDFTRLQIQLQMLPDLIETRNKKLSPGEVPISKVTNVRTFLNQDMPMSGEMFSEVKHLLKIFYTIPVTTATAERSFSALRRLKTFLRSTMSQERLNHTMLLYVHKGRTDTIDVVNIARLFIQENQRRINFFGKL